MTWDFPEHYNHEVWDLHLLATYRTAMVVTDLLASGKRYRIQKKSVSVMFG